MRHKRWPPPASGVGIDEIIAGRTTAFTLAPGNPMRAAACLICTQAAGGHLVMIFTVFSFRVPAQPCGSFAASSWLIHDTHPPQDDATLAALATVRHRLCMERQP